MFSCCRCKKHPASSLGGFSALILFNMVEKRTREETPAGSHFNSTTLPRFGFCPQVKNGFFVIQQAGLRSTGDDRINPSISLTLFSLEAERRWFSAEETTWTEFHWGNLAGDYRQTNVSSTTSKVFAVIAKWSFLHYQQRNVSQITIKSILVMTVYCLHDILHVRKEVKNKSGEVMEQKQS